ncbi:MAG: PH domain-containing protein [Thermomicrobiales bacterium]
MPNQQDVDPNAVPLDHSVDDERDTNTEVTWPGTAAALSTWPYREHPAVAEAAPGVIPLPEERLDPRASTIWLINNLIATGIVTIIASAIMYVLYRWRHTDLIWVIGIPVALLILQLIASWIDVIVRYRQWRFEIRADEVDLKHGFITHTRQLVPMSRIQHVDTRQGPLERHYGLSSVIFYTAAGSMEIPALSVARAGEVRNQIAALAKVHDDL